MSHKYNSEPKLKNARPFPGIVAYHAWWVIGWGVEPTPRAVAKALGLSERRAAAGILEARRKGLLDSSGQVALAIPFSDISRPTETDAVSESIIGTERIRHG